MSTLEFAVIPERPSPFRLGIGPDQVFAHAGWKAARDALLAAVRSGSGSTLLIGAAGSGKSLMLADVADTLRAEGTAVVLGLGGAEAEDGAVMLLDEARRCAALPDSCHAVLADLPVFEARMASLRTPLAIVRLEPLPPAVARAFIAERLRHAGCPPHAWAREAVDALVEAANGLPRMLCTLGGSAMHLSALDGEDQVTARHVREAVEMHGIHVPQSGMTRAVPVAASAAPAAAPVKPTPSNFHWRMEEPPSGRPRFAVLAAALLGVALAGFAIAHETWGAAPSPRSVAHAARV